MDFEAPPRTWLFFLATPREYFSKLKLRWIGKHVPRADARWIGNILACISHDQIRDAFATRPILPNVEGFAGAFEARIGQLEKL